MDKKINIVFSGGGLLGIAYVGAVKVLEEMGYTYNKFAGTSAGSIVATLLASGYKEWELKSIMMQQNFNTLLQNNYLNHLPFKIGKMITLFKYKGMYKTNLLEKWIEELLLKKNVRTFNDLKNAKGEYKLKIYAADINKESPVVFPDDLHKYGIEPDDFSVAKAVTISCSIPYFFMPYKLGKSLLVDGGVIGSFPIWAFDKETAERTVGFYFKENIEQSKKMSFLNYSNKIIKTVINRDEYLFNNHDYKSIGIPTYEISSTEFDISTENKIRLYNSGYMACKVNLKI